MLHPQYYGEKLAEDALSWAIRETQHGMEMPIITITAHAKQGARKKRIQVGCDEYIAKPVNYSELLEFVARYSRGLASKAVVHSRKRFKTKPSANSRRTTGLPNRP